MHLHNFIDGMDAVSVTRGNQGKVRITDGLNGRDGRQHLLAVITFDHQHIIMLSRFGIVPHE